MVSFIGLFYKRDFDFKETTNRSHPITWKETKKRDLGKRPEKDLEVTWKKDLRNRLGKDTKRNRP